jgi:two-component system, OmpR family, phosphate regulon sensor histidine kinase PhoR
MTSVQTLRKRSLPQSEYLSAQCTIVDRVPSSSAPQILGCTCPDLALEMSEQSWCSALMHSSPDLIGMVSFDGHWLRLNPAGQTLLQWNPDSPILPTLLETLCETEEKIWHQTILPALMQQGHWQGTLRFRQALGQSIAFSSQWFIVRDRYTNEPLGLATISRISPESAEVINPTTPASDFELQQTLAHEKALNQQKSQFLSDVSHELKAPLSVIASSAEILELMGHRLEKSRQEKHFQKIKLKVKQMTQLLEDLLLLSKAEHSQDLLQQTNTDLVPFCAEIVDEIQMSTTCDQIVFSAFYSPQPDQSRRKLETAIAQVDPRLLQRVISNLLSNSVKYSPEGETIYFDLVDAANTIVFQVRDSGIGIPLEDQPWLFQSFYRASNVKAIPGTGLGLAIVKRCVELHGGTITVDSEVGVGTTFVVELPKKRNRVETFRRNVSTSSGQ